MNRKIATLGLTLGLLVSTSAAAITIGYRPRTGDVWIDTHLSDINRFGRADNDYFIDDVVSSFGAPRYFVRDLLVTRRWEPADVYYACALAHHVNRPCMDIVRDHGDDRGQGWGVIAQRLGIKPGSAEFHALKGKLDKSDARFRTRFPRDARPSGGGKAGSVERGRDNPRDAAKGKGRGEDQGGKGKGAKAKDKGKPKGKGH